MSLPLPRTSSSTPTPGPSRGVAPICTQCDIVHGHHRRPCPARVIYAFCFGASLNQPHFLHHRPSAKHPAYTRRTPGLLLSPKIPKRAPPPPPHPRVTATATSCYQQQAPEAALCHRCHRQRKTPSRSLFKGRVTCGSQTYTHLHARSPAHGDVTCNSISATC